MPYFFPKSYRRGKLCFQITFLFSVVSFRFVWFRFVSFRSVSFRFVSISFRTLQVPIDNARFYCFVRINIQGRVCLNVTIRDCWKLYCPISLMYLFTEFPAFTMFAISCHALFFPQKLSTRKTLLSNNFSLLVLLQQYNFVSICPIWLPLRHFFFYFQQSNK
jgi:hypothetical protein